MQHNISISYFTQIQKICRLPGISWLQGCCVSKNKLISRARQPRVSLKLKSYALIQNLKIVIAIFRSVLDLRLMVKRLISLRFPCGCCALLIMSCIKFLYFDGYDICAEFIGKLPPHCRMYQFSRSSELHKLFFPLCKFHSHYNLSK